MELPGFDLLAKIGEGGMGAVYRARDRALSRDVAVKFLAGRGPEEPEARRRFEREAQAVARLNHRHIVQLYGYHPEAQPPYFVMELVDGLPLTRAVHALPLRRRAEILEHVARAVHHAHERGLVHRDLKPSNILVDAAGEPKVLDFGLARLGLSEESRLTKTGQILGTPAYASPEQARGQADVGPEADLFSLGAVLYEAITGALPFPAADPLAMLARIVRDDPAFPRQLNPDCPEPLQRICLVALEKSPAHRYRSAQEFADDLHRFLAGEPVLARPTLYVNLLAGRVQAHVDELARWREENLLTQREYDGLRGRYEGLLAEEAEWIGQSRRVTASLVALYLGGWLAILSCYAWIAHFWDELSPAERTASVVLPTLVLNAVGAWLWVRQRWRAAIAFLMCGALLVPAAILVSLSQFQVFAGRDADARELFAPAYFSNLQVLVACLLATLYYGLALRSTRSTAFAVLLAVGGLACYGAELSRWGLKEWVEDGPVARALAWVLPAATAYQGIGWLLDRARVSRYAGPFVVCGGALLVGALSGLALYAPGDWFSMEEEDQDLATKLGFMANGLVYYAAAWVADRHGAPLLRRQAYLFYLITPASFLVPLHLLYDRGPLLASLGRAPLHLGEFLLPWTCLAFLLLAVPLQLKTFFYSGLIYLALAFETTTTRHFLGVRAWPLAMAAGGLAVMGAGLWLERRLAASAGDPTTATPTGEATRLRPPAAAEAGPATAQGSETRSNGA
ncbi:MAG: DUF2157 domain-containing protein [Planctomycetes bacterium]|nr:DUF2157 domain-containing protein [Planctomycetota bacterium]